MRTRRVSRLDEAFSLYFHYYTSRTSSSLAFSYYQRAYPASSGALYAFDTHIAFIYIYTQRQSRVLFSNVELSWQVGSLLSRISARGCGVCVQHTRTSAHFLVHTYTRIQVHRSGRGIYRVFYCNRCLLLRGPGDAVTFSASPLLELVLAAFARVPPSPRVASPAVTHREAFFALFATWSGIDPIPDAARGWKARGAAATTRQPLLSPLIFSSLPPPPPLSLSSFFLYGRQYFRTNEAITIVISG